MATKYIQGDPITAMSLVLTEAEQAYLTDDSTYGTTPDPDFVTTYIQIGESIADTYVSGRYPWLTAINAPEAFKHAILVIAKKRMLNRRGYSHPALDEEFGDVRDWLRAIHDERADLLPPAPDEEENADNSFDYGFVDPDTLDLGGFASL